MTMQESRTTLVRTPKFYELYERLRRMKVENPDAVIVAMTPFVQAKDGHVTCYPCPTPALLPPAQITHEFVLSRDVENLHAWLLICRSESPDLSGLEEWCEAALEVVECACRVHDGLVARTLREQHRLH